MVLRRAVYRLQPALYASFPRLYATFTGLYACFPRLHAFVPARYVAFTGPLGSQSPLQPSRAGRYAPIGGPSAHLVGLLHSQVVGTCSFTGLHLTLK